MADLQYFEGFARNKRSEQAFPEPDLNDSELRQLEGLRNQIPCLESLQNGRGIESYHGRLVQLRALVVETLDPEIYPGAIQEQDGVWSCGKYGYEVPSLANNSARNVAYWERQPVAVKPLPGLSTWCHTCLRSGTSVDTVSEALSRTTGLGESKQQSLTDTAFPSQQPESVVVLLHKEAAKSVRIHDVIDVIGVLDPLLHEDAAHMDVQDVFDDFMAQDDDMDEAIDAENVDGNQNMAVPTNRQPKASHALRVHAMHVQRFSNQSCSPYDLLLVKRTLASDFMASMRVAAIQWLAAPFGGDELLGELLLLQLLCKSPKVTKGTATRRMTMNICGLAKATSTAGDIDPSKMSSGAINEPYGYMATRMPSPGSGLPPGSVSSMAAQVAEAISAIYPFVQIVPVTDQATACHQLMPTHNASSNRLHCGLMQQAPHTCIVMDECISKLSTSSQEHDASQSRNFRALHEYMRDGVITANYMWQQVRLPVSGSVIALSDEPSTFSDSCRICVTTAGDPGNSSVSVDPSHPLQGIRCYLACAWDLWDGLEYERQNGGDAGSHPRWLTETLVAQGRKVAAAVNGAVTSHDTTRAFETAVILLQCLCISQGNVQISRSDWSAVENLADRCKSKAAANAASPECKPLHAAPVHVQECNAHQDGNAQMDTGEHVLRERQPQQETSAGEAMINALRRTGAL